MNEEKSMANISNSCLKMEENNSTANYSEIMGSQVKSENRIISRIVTEIILSGVLQEQSRRTCAFSQDLSSAKKANFSFILSLDEKNLFVVMITESTI